MAHFFGDALTEIKKIKGKSDGHLDYDTLPAFAKTIGTKDIYEPIDVVNRNGSITKEQIKVGEILEERRDVGAMVTMLVVAIQQLTKRVEDLEKK